MFQKLSEESLGEENDKSSMMWIQDWLLDLSTGEVISGLDKSHFRRRKEKIRLERVQVRMKRGGRQQV